MKKWPAVQNHELLKGTENFAFETTLATKIYRLKIEKAKQNGYMVTLLFFWLQSIELAKERVKVRVQEGGHNIDTDVIERRYTRGIKIFFDIYLPIVDGALVFDNSFGKHELLAQKTADGHLTIIDSFKFEKLKSMYDHS